MASVRFVWLVPIVLAGGCFGFALPPSRLEGRGGATAGQVAGYDDAGEVRTSGPGLASQLRFSVHPLQGSPDLVGRDFDVGIGLGGEWVALASEQQHVADLFFLEGTFYPRVRGVSPRRADRWGITLAPEIVVDRGPSDPTTGAGGDSEVGYGATLGLTREWVVYTSGRHRDLDSSGYFTGVARGELGLAVVAGASVRRLHGETYQLVTVGLQARFPAFAFFAASWDPD